jgi:hypothetical protein
MTEASALSRHDLEAKIVKRCWEDEAFRKEFTADPAGAFLKFLQIPAADLPKIVIHEEEPGFWHVVLPAKPEFANELSEEDLERIAGGNTTLRCAWAIVSSLYSVGGTVISVGETIQAGW